MLNVIPALSFGVPLSVACETSLLGNGIPLILSKCIEFIENVCISSEGIYRISGRVTDVQDLRMNLETDAQNYDLGKIEDINCVAAVIKAFIKEIPESLFNLNTKQRSEYSAITNAQERCDKLKWLIKLLPTENKTVLRYLIAHLLRYISNNERISARSSENRMGLSNLSVVFSAVIFPEMEAPVQSSKKGKEEERLVLNAQIMSLVKSDLVVFPVMVGHG